MTSKNSWKKVENEAGYPCYIDEATGKQQYDHPQFENIIQSLNEYNGIKYPVYRIAFKIYALQGYFKVPPHRICSGVFTRHQLSLSESSLSLDTAELEAVLADIYFAAEKEGCFSGNVDLTVDLLINLLLNVYDKERKEPIRVQAAKTLLIILSDEMISEKWLALANCCADHNGCVSSRRLAALLTHVVAMPMYFGEQSEEIQNDIDGCFAKSAGMLGVTCRTVAEWGPQGCASARWLLAAQRIARTRKTTTQNNINCAACVQPLVQVLKFKCSKCNEMFFCETCYLYDKDLTMVNGHKNTHLVREVLDGEIPSTDCLGFIKSMKRFFFCTKTKTRRVQCTKKKTAKLVARVEDRGSVRQKRDGRPIIFTSTVGKASGNSTNNPTALLQDIINQLETHNRALKELSTQDHAVNEGSHDAFKAKVDTHWNQISKQICRLKTLKQSLSMSPPDLMDPLVTDEESQNLDNLFSPIPIVDERQSKINDIKNHPRVLSLDSGNFSAASKQGDGQNLLTMSGDALKPVVVNATSDSISTVSMNDISTWYNESIAPDKHIRQSVKSQSSNECTSQSLCATEQKFAADIRSVETSTDKMKEHNADLNSVLDRLQQILSNHCAMDDSCIDNTQLRESANEMEDLLGTLIRGVEQRVTLNAAKGMV